MELQKKPLRILVLTYIYTDGDPRYGGEGRVVWETTEALARSGAKVFVVTSMKKLTTKPHPNITLYQIPFAKKDFLNFNDGELLKMFFFCIPLLFLKKIDVIHHLPTNGPNPFARFKFGRIFAESADPTWDYTNPKFSAELALDRANKRKEAGFTSPPRRDLSTRIAQRVFPFIRVNDKFPRGTDIFFCRTRGMITALQELHPKSLCVYVPNGVNATQFSPEMLPLLPRTQGLRFLHVGSISRRKGVHYIVEAFISVIKKYPHNELLLTGGGEPAFVEELKNMSASHPQIRFYGMVPDEKLPHIYTSADVFCLVTLGGSTLTVFGEALASGLPVIATIGSGGGEAVAEHDAGFLVEPGDAESLAQAMTRIIEHKDLLIQKKQNALRASKFFTWDYIAQELIRSYTAALQKRAQK